MQDSGLKIDAAATLDELLGACFTEADCGFRQFGDIEDLWVRAVLSDETRQAAAGVLTNLNETYLHEDLFRQTMGHGLPYAGTGSDGAVFRRYDEAELHVAGFLRAFGSTLDCLAGVCIGVLRAGWNIRMADWDQVAKIHEPIAKVAKKLTGTAAEPQRKAWEALVALAASADSKEPPGWLAWGLQARNGVVHRSRQLDLLSQLAPAFPEGFVAITEDPVASQLESGGYKFHLRRRPWLSDMHDIALAGGADDLVFEEHADLTLTFLRMNLNDLVESVSGHLLECWRLGASGEFSSEPLVTAFVVGFRDEPLDRSGEFAARPAWTELRANAFAGHPELGRRVAVAQALNVEGFGPPAK